MARRILIVDDVATNRIVFKVKLGDACYETLFATDGRSCLQLSREGAPDLILLNQTLPDIDGIEVLRRLRADPATRDVPVVMILAQADSGITQLALRAGVDDVLVKPIDDPLLMARLRCLLRGRERDSELSTPGAALSVIGFADGAEGFEPPGTVALVTCRPETALLWRKELLGHLSDRVVVLSRDEALAEAAEGAGRIPDVYVIEAALAADGGGLRLMSDLRSQGGSCHAAVCMMLPESTGAAAAMAFDLGADDLVAADVEPRELALRLRRLLRVKRRADRMRATVQDGLRLAMIDPLTGLHNRRYALAQIERIAERARVSPDGFAVMVIDLDRFKRVNDVWGHAAGDAVLVEVARRLTANLRGTDLLARIGGEEFLAVLPDTGLMEARRTAERLCRAVQFPLFGLPGGGQLGVTISIGLAVVRGGPDPGPGADLTRTVIERADRALLKAKAGGRNQVTISRSAA